MRGVMKTDESTGQLQKSLIGFTELFPADQETTPAIEPGEQPFHHPSARRFAWFQAVGSVLWWLIPFVVLRIEPHVRLVAPFVQLAIDGIMIVGRIQAQVLRVDDGWLWAIKTERIQGGEQQFAIMSIGPFDTQGQWESTTITQYAPFGSLFAAISRSGSDGGLSERGLDRRTVHALPIPSDADQFIVVVQLRLPQTLKEALRFPVPKAIIDGTRCSQLTRQRIPLDAGTQHIDNCGKHVSIISGWSSSFGVGRTWWYQGTHSLPQFIAHFPRSCSCHVSFSPHCVFVFIVSLVFG